MGRRTPILALQPNRVLKTCGVAGLLGLTMHSANAQINRGYIMQTGPYPVYATPETANYNIKWGKMIARFNANLSAEYSDNINLSETNPRSDFSIGPFVNVGFMYPLSQENLLQFDAGFGYRWYMNSPEVNSLSLAPNSRLDYRMFVGNVSLNFHDNISIQTDPVFRPEISGGSGSFIDFQRFHNVVGVIGEWRPYRRWSFVGGYDYTLDRTLNRNYLAQDYDGHTFSGGAYYQVSSRMLTGLTTSYNLTQYRDSAQNDGNSFNVGPFVSWELNRYFTVDLSGGYTWSAYENRGLIADTSSFEGFTFQTSLRHRINRRMNQSLRFGRSASQGFGSNFTESYSVQHSYNWQMNRALGLNTLFSYENYSASNIGGDAGVRYLLYAGLNYHLGRRWSTALGYSFAWKDSDLAGLDYTQNRVTWQVQRSF